VHSGLASFVYTIEVGSEYVPTIARVYHVMRRAGLVVDRHIYISVLTKLLCGPACNVFSHPPYLFQVASLGIEDVRNNERRGLLAKNVHECLAIREWSET